LKQEIRVIPVKITRDVIPGDRLYDLILHSTISQKIKLNDGDIVVIAQKIVSKAESQIVPLNSLVPSDFALRLAKASGKDPRVTELILRQSKSIIRVSNGVIITETKHGFVCANAGIDQSNIMDSDQNALLLPDDPDASAKQIMKMLRKKTLKVTEIAIVDELASAAELVMGKSICVPIAIVRGYDYKKSENSSINELIRAKEKDLFR
jgi:coenzyme F420-0:L-glutamate ligase / coenzyme F420-1:gamma-L-glutamate ligase